MQFLRGKFQPESRTVRLPNGRKVKVSREHTGLISVIDQVEDGDHLHAVVQPEALHAAIEVKPAVPTGGVVVRPLTLSASVAIERPQT